MQIEHYTAPIAPHKNSFDQASKPNTNTTGHKERTEQNLSYRENSRTAGTIAVWTPISTPPSTEPEKALNGALAAMETAAPSLVPPKVMSYADTQQIAMKDAAAKKAVKPFGFGDIVDMINPLHHLPLIGHIYREISGDDITPISRIIGGGVYGGGIGAGTALANVIVEHGTGHDVSENIVKFAASPLQKEGKQDADNKTQALPAQLLRYTSPPVTSRSIVDNATAPPENKSGWTSFTLNG